MIRHLLALNAGACALVNYLDNRFNTGGHGKQFRDFLGVSRLQNPPQPSSVFALNLTQ